MAIQMRRGNEADLDKTKLVSGEIAVSVDADKVRVSKGNGETIDLATQDDLQNIIKLDGGVTIEENTLVISPEEETIEEQGTPVDIESISIDGGMTDNPIKDTTAREGIATLNGKLGANNGIATLNGTGKVPESQLPSYVDDVIEGYLYNGVFYEDAQHTTPITGESGKIYVDLSTDKTYRWSGTVYICTGSSLELGEVTGTAYEGSKGKANADNIAAINNKIPSSASTTNKLVTQQDLEGIGVENTKALINSTVGWESKNVLCCNIEAGTYTDNGITYVVNRDENGKLLYIQADGTASGDSKLTIPCFITIGELDNYIPKDEYILNGCPEGGSNVKYKLVIQALYGQQQEDTGSGKLITEDISGDFELSIKILSGITATALKFYPQIRSKDISDSSYEFYHTSVRKALDTKINSTLADSMIDKAVGWTGKNMIPMTLDKLKEINTLGTWDNNVYTHNEISYTIYTDEEGYVTKISTSGISPASNFSQLYLDSGTYANIPYTPLEKYKMTGLPDGASQYLFSFVIGAGMYNDTITLNDVDIEFPRKSKSTSYYVSIYVASDYNVDMNDKDFYPMIREAGIDDTSFAPYHSTVKEELEKNKVTYAYSEGRLTLNLKAANT